LCVIEEAVGGKGDDRLIGNSGSNVLKGRKGADLIYAGMGSANVVVGGKGRDQFLVDTNPGAYVKVKDFKRSKDQLVFDGPEMAVSFQSSKKNTDVFSDGVVVATLMGVQDFDPGRHAVFSSFDTFDL